MNLNESDFLSELYYKSSLSSGKGGQHVNKTESRISLFFDVENSIFLTLEEKRKLLNYKGVKCSKTNIWQIDVEQHRSQLKNKKKAIELFLNHLKKALKTKPPRKKTKKSKASIEKRLKDKKAKSQKKESRKKDFLD